MALAGGNLIATDQCVETLTAVNILNAVAGALGKTIRFYDQDTAEVASHDEVNNLISDLNSGQIKLLVIDDSNPVYTLPRSMEFVKAMKKALEEMQTKDGFHGYGPEQGYLWLRKAISAGSYQNRGCRQLQKKKKNGSNQLQMFPSFS